MAQRVRIPHRGHGPSSATQLPILTALHARSPTLFPSIIHQETENVNRFFAFSVSFCPPQKNSWRILFILMKKLPKLYTNTFDKKIDNSIEYIKINNIKENEKIYSKYTIKEKIDNLFKSKNYIYKINVEIELINGNINCTIIGKTKNSLITLDNNLININDIIDIRLLNN